MVTIKIKYKDTKKSKDKTVVAKDVTAKSKDKTNVKSKKKTTKKATKK
jgi:hypothetical protein